MEDLQKSESKEANHGWAWFWMIIAVLYSISPVDIIPDVIPVAGWVDDILGLGTAAVNLLQSYTAQSNAFMSSVLKIVKYILICVGVIAVGVISILAVLVYKL